jgi:N-acetylglucosaminyldiphosphoundecaprenol N-acetyl-beta-D-mannosaminyltransferase
MMTDSQSVNKPARDERVDVLGLEIDNVSFDETVERIIGFIEKSEPVFIVTPNVDHTNHCRKHEKYRALLKDAALVVADGVPLLWAARLFGHRLKGRVNGTDLFIRMAQVCAKRGYRMFLLGAMPHASRYCAVRLIDSSPRLQISGRYSPPYGFEHDPEENRKIVRMIREVQPDILFVGLPGPKAEFWIHDHYRRIGVPVSVNVGASFDFVSGSVKRSPLIMQKLGMEWLYRLVTQPGKLWKRYVLGNSIFLMRVFVRFIRHIFGKLIPRRPRQAAIRRE